MAGDALKTVKLRAEDNGWFLLATLYGQPTRDDWELKSKNREAWNRYMASASRALGQGSVRGVEQCGPGNAGLPL
jgi:hypothetical protein